MLRKIMREMKVIARMVVEKLILLCIMVTTCSFALLSVIHISPMVYFLIAKTTGITVESIWEDKLIYWLTPSIFALGFIYVVIGIIIFKIYKWASNFEIFKRKEK